MKKANKGNERSEMGDKMETFSARLASFDTVLPSIHSSTSRNIQPIAWPYDSPSPEQLANAGFYFNPYDTNPDNTTCFLCRRALDGWEEGDEPIAEHLKHSPNCGWAILMDIQQKTSNPAEIEDPTSTSIVEARRATFAIGWPHDGKPGWVCQSEKMVEAGWYFCPNEESPDLASCPYCKLSLDGWEETDNPFEEHHRRSSDCSFFVYALPAAKSTKKSTRSKKPRVSKASRLSTQSVMTTTSEAPTVDDDMMDVSVMSQSTSKKAKSAKKPTKSRTKKTKKEEPLEVTELGKPEPAEARAPEPDKPKRAIRGRKRGSEAIAQEPSIVDSTEHETAVETEEPSPKRRATEIRRSVAQAPEDLRQDFAEEPPVDEATSPVMPKKGRKGTKKSTAAKSRKASTASSSGRSTKNKIPDDSVLEAAIEADIARNMEDPEPFEFHYKDEERESARFRQQSILASMEIAPEAQSENDETQANQAEVEVTAQSPVPEPEAESVIEAAVETKAKKTSKRKATTKKSKKEKAPTQLEPEHEAELEPEPELVELLPSKPAPTTQSEVSRAHSESLEIAKTPEETMEVEHSGRHSSVVADIDMMSHQSESESENIQQPGEKQGRKAASKGKKATTWKKTEKSIVSYDETNELARTDTIQNLDGAAEARGNASKRKSQGQANNVVAVDQREDREEPVHAEVIEKPQVKAKRGRPSKAATAIQATQPEKQVVEVKPKRGRPSKQRTKNQDRDEKEIVDQPMQEQADREQSPQRSKMPPKTTKRFSDLPKDSDRAQSFIESVTQESSPLPRSQNTTRVGVQEKTPSPSPQSSDAENQPPSTRPRSARPPIISPSKTLATRIPLAASTPTQSPSKRQVNSGYLSSTHSWRPTDIEELLGSINDKENRDFTFNQSNLKEILTSPEKKMTVEEWIYYNAKNGEERLRRECERLIGIFESEGGRAMTALEGIECID